MTAPTDTTETPRVWVGCLACYNDGTLRGEWVDATEAGDFVPCHGRDHEEWWCFDHEGFGGLLAGECSPMEAQRVAELIERLDAWQPVAALAAWCDHVGLSGSGWPDLEQFSDEFAGEWNTLADYAEELFEDTAPSREVADMLGSWPFNCIDWERAARELDFGGDVWTAEAPGGALYVFRAC
jgi:antirestriction protein